MKTIDSGPGDFLYDVLEQAFNEAPARFTFNAWTFETRVGETLREARDRFKQEHGYEVLTREESAANAKRVHDAMVEEHKNAIAAAGVATEKELRDAKVPSPDSPEALMAYIATLTERPHDYGTCVYAMSMAATAAFNYVASKLGVTGFQASCADMDILRRTRGWEWGKILDYSNLLYPQYCDASHFPNAEALMEEHKDKLCEMALAKIAEAGGVAHPNVLAHWRMLAANGADQPNLL